MSSAKDVAFEMLRSQAWGELQKCPSLKLRDVARVMEVSPNQGPVYFKTHELIQKIKDRGAVAPTPMEFWKRVVDACNGVPVKSANQGSGIPSQ